MSLHLPLLVSKLVLGQDQLTFLLHSLVDFHGELLLILLFDGFDVFPSSVLDKLSVLLVALHHLLDVQAQRFLLGLKLLTLEHLITVELLHEVFVGQVGLTHQHFKLLQVVLLLLLQLVVAVLIGLALLCLIIRLLVETVAVVIHASVDLFLVVTLHVSCLLLDAVHFLLSLKFLFLLLTSQVFGLLEIFLVESRCFLLTVAVFSRDRLFQVPDLLLQLVSLLFLD